MKRALLIVISFIMVICFALAGCGEYNSLSSRPGGSGSNDPSNPSGPIDPSGPQDGDDEEHFTVSLSYHNSKYVPRTNIYAQWTGSDGNIYRAQFNTSGVAEANAELDGEYRVTLGNVPENFAYNPNIYLADNDNKHITVVLEDYRDLTAVTELIYSQSVTLSLNTIYRLVLPKTKYFGLFRISGCIFETWCDIVENDINVKLTGYMSNGGGFINEASAFTLAGGGASSSYTKNIRADLSQGDTAGMNMFMLTATSRSGRQPIVVFFRIGERGSNQGGDEPYIPPKEYEIEDRSLLKMIQPSGTFSFCWQYTSGKVCRGSDYKLFPKGETDSEGNQGDGYWHEYDAEKNVYGRILYAVISRDTPVIQTESLGGLAALSLRIPSEGISYDKMMSEYVKFCNRDGAHPVTEDLRKCIYSFALREHYFDDGNGWCEDGSGLNIRSNETDMWLFTCGMYGDWVM